MDPPRKSLPGPLGVRTEGRVELAHLVDYANWAFFSQQPPSSASRSLCWCCHRMALSCRAFFALVFPPLCQLILAPVYESKGSVPLGRDGPVPAIPSFHSLHLVMLSTSLAVATRGPRCLFSMAHAMGCFSHQCSFSQLRSVAMQPVRPPICSGSSCRYANYLALAFLLPKIPKSRHVSLLRGFPLPGNVRQSGQVASEFVRLRHIMQKTNRLTEHYPNGSSHSWGP